MAIQFDFYRTPLSKEEAESGEEKFHARVVGGQTLDLDGMIEHISKRCTLTKGDIQAVISELHDEMVDAFCRGNRVNIPGIGLFSLTLSAPLDATPQKTHSQHIGIKKIDFRADQRLKEDVEGEAVFERSREKNHSEALNIYEIDALLVDYFEENSYITCRRFAQLCGFTRNTAIRHLKRLRDEGRIVNTNTPHQPVYVPAKGYYGK